MTKQRPIQAVRIWLSASIPDEATDEERAGISVFIDQLVKTCMREGWILLHGSHPSVVPLIQASATAAGCSQGKQGGPVLVRSEFFAASGTTNDNRNISEIQSFCAEPMIRLPAAIDSEQNLSREKSLESLRHTLLAQSNILIAIGGRWWLTNKPEAGVPAEVDLAYHDQLPVFLLSGFGGALRGYVEQDREYRLKYCRNGFSEQENSDLALLADPKTAVEKISNQIKRLPVRERLPGAGKPFRILSLDGGGIRGIFTAKILEEWEERTGLNICDHFDLIAGTSTGGLIAIGLGLGRSARELREFYEHQGNKIFPSDDSVQGMWHGLRHWFTNKFDSTILEEKIRLALNVSTSESTALDASGCRLIIPAYNRNTDTPLLFRTSHRSHNSSNSDDAVVAALSTTAAPTYFSAVKVDGGVHAIDGGIWANNPSMVAIAEATEVLNIDISRIELLSVGTTYNTEILSAPNTMDHPITDKLIESLLPGPIGKIIKKVTSKKLKQQVINGRIGWVANIADLFMKTQAQATEYECKSLLASDRYLRVNLPSNAGSIDDIDAIPELLGLAEQAALDYFEKVQSRFLNGLVVEKWH